MAGTRPVEKRTAVNSHPLHRVVGVRTDKSRSLICEHVTKEQADRIQATVIKAGGFASVIVEPIAEPPPKLDLKASDDRLRPT